MSNELLVISGGQTGVDQAGLEAALSVGLRTAGWMPYGWLTLEGCCPEFREKYGMAECQEPGYAARTELNARDSDGTIRIAKNFGTPGERCTLIALHKYDKPHLDLSSRKLPQPEFALDWLLANHIKTLNVAGNSEDSAPGIFAQAKSFLATVFLLWKDRYAQADVGTTPVQPTGTDRIPPDAE